MDLLIRDVEPFVIKQVADLAKKQGLSREEYLRRKIKQMATLDLEMERIDKYANLVIYMEDVVKRNTNVMERIELLLNEKE